MLTEADLPDDPEALRAIIAETHAAIARCDAKIVRLKTAGEHAEAEIKRLHDIITALQRHRFGARSEKLAEDQLKLGSRHRTEAGFTLSGTNLQRRAC